MTSKLPSFIRLPGYNQFEYKLRYHDPNKEHRENPRRRIKFTTKHFQSDSPLTDQFKRQKVYSGKKFALVTIVIRVIIILLIVGIIWLLFHGVSLMKQPT